MLGNRLETRYNLVGRLDDLTKAMIVTKDALPQASGSIVASTQHNLRASKLKLLYDNANGENY